MGAGIFLEFSPPTFEIVAPSLPCTDSTKSASKFIKNADADCIDNQSKEEQSHFLDGDDEADQETVEVSFKAKQRIK